MPTSIYLWDNKILTVDGKIAVDQACCCDESGADCCGCADPSTAQSDLQVDITGGWAWSGTVPVQESEDCWRYEEIGLTADSGCSQPLFDITIRCPAEGDGLEDVIVEMLGDNACDYENIAQVSATCDPFRLEYSADIIDGTGGPGSCPCDGDTLTIVITLP